MKEIVDLLNSLDEHKVAMDVNRIARQEALDKVYTPEIKAQIGDIEAEFDTKGEFARKRIMDIEKEIKSLVIEHGETVKGSQYMAVYAKARITWETKQLDAYMVSNPEIFQFRKIGNPSASIRKISR